MTDYTKPFPCTQCGKMVRIEEKHTFVDCQMHLNKYIRNAVISDRARIRSEFSIEIIKKMGDNWTYGQIERFIDKSINVKNIQ